MKSTKPMQDIRIQLKLMSIIGSTSIICRIYLLSLSILYMKTVKESIKMKNPFNRQHLLSTNLPRSKASFLTKEPIKAYCCTSYLQNPFEEFRAKSLNKDKNYTHRQPFSKQGKNLVANPSNRIQTMGTFQPSMIEHSSQKYDIKTIGYTDSQYYNKQKSNYTSTYQSSSHLCHLFFDRQFSYKTDATLLRRNLSQNPQRQATLEYGIQYSSMGLKAQKKLKAEGPIKNNESTANISTESRDTQLFSCEYTIIEPKLRDKNSQQTSQSISEYFPVHKKIVDYNHKYNPYSSDSDDDQQNKKGPLCDFSMMSSTSEVKKRRNKKQPNIYLEQQSCSRHKDIQRSILSKH